MLYFGTPVVWVSSQNLDGSPNLAPMSSTWWLGYNAMHRLGPRLRPSRLAEIPEPIYRPISRREIGKSAGE